MPLATLQDLESAVQRFNTEFPRPHMNVILGACFDLRVHYNDLQQVFEKKAGVYVLLNENNEVIRIGSAVNDLFRRLNSYFDYQDENKVAGIGWWKEGISARYIHPIVVPEEQVFEALAIECYLLRELTPPLNKEGKNIHIQYRKKMVKGLNRLATIYGWKNVARKWYTDETP